MVTLCRGTSFRFAELGEDNQVVPRTATEILGKARSRDIRIDEIGATVVCTRFVPINLGVECDLWFETTISGGPLDRCFARYGGYSEAIRGHEEVVEIVRRKQQGRAST